MEPIIASIIELLIFSVPTFMFTMVLRRKYVLDKVGERTLTILTCFGVILPWIDVAEAAWAFTYLGIQTEGNLVVQFLYTLSPVVAWSWIIGFHVLASAGALWFRRDAKGDHDLWAAFALVFLNVIFAVITVGNVIGYYYWLHSLH
ncbi:hypothetical protein MUP77_11555 [Candidatus Bathyarchaeota archaeon]|nr:hypothetical protein [Candidatus Bathyarchaeota archaeon]